MAYVNVADWKPDQVADWLKGLDVSIHRYVESFLNNHVNGQHLLNLQPDDLEHHGIYKVGHQEIILEAVDHLRNFHYELDHENLQLLALRVSCLAHSLHRELWNSSPVVSTQTLSDIATIIKAVKPLVCWLDRPPFSGQLAYIDKKAELLRLSLEMATSGQRDRFAERPIESIRTSSKRLSELADEMIREIHDPLLLQPASLDLATLKKRPGDHLGFCIIPSFHGNHQIGEIKCNSTAYQSGKIECGDEIVQINYQTVVGWEVKQVMALFEESSSDIFLTLKKRPCHSKILGQIYMKPYRLPSKKQVSYASKWYLGDNISSPRINIGGHFDIKPLGNQLSNSVTTVGRNKKSLPEAIVIPKEDVHNVNMNVNKIIEKEEEEEEDNDQEEEEESISSPTSVRLYLPKPRLPVQRRATITGTGASPTSKRAPLNLEQLWHELKLEREWRLSGKQRKGEKSTSEILLSTASCDTGSVEGKINLKSATKACSADCLKSVQSEFCCGNKPLLSKTGTKFILENGTELGKHSKDTELTDSNNSSVVDDSNVNFIPLKERIESLNKQIDSSTSPLTSVKPKIPTRKFIPNEGFSSLNNSPVHRGIDKKPVARPRGKLDKSNSTPVYDLNDKSQSNITLEQFKHNLNSFNILKQSSPSNQSKLDQEENKPVLKKDDSDQRNQDKSILNTQSSKSLNTNTATVDKSGAFKRIEWSDVQLLPDRIVISNPYIESSGIDNTETVPNKQASRELVIPKEPSPNSNKTSPDVPKPAIRILKKEPSKSATDPVQTYNSNENGISPLKSQLYPKDMHISDSKDSVFIDDEMTNGAQIQNHHQGKENLSFKPPNEKIYLSQNNLQNNKQPIISSINISFPSTSPKIKHNSDSESLSGVFNSKDILIDSKIVSKPGNHINSVLVVPPSSPNSNIISSIESPDNKFQVQICQNIGSANENSTHDNSLTTRSLPPEPPNKEEILRKFLSGNQSNISYSADNRVQVSIPPSLSSSSKSNIRASSSTEAMNKLAFICSTPIKQFNQETSFCQQPSTYPRKKPEVKSIQSPPSTSISHNSSLRAMIPLISKHKPTSPKVFRKKNNILRGKRRNIGVKDLVMPECEGWLFQRDRKISTVPQWIRGWFVIVGNNFYGFTDKDSTKAHLFIYLPGFTVAPAVEVKSRNYALKIYHTGTTFYLAADSQDEFATWLNCLSLAIIAHDRSPVENITFSESEDEKSDDKSSSDKSKEHCFSSPKVKKMSQLLTGQLSNSKNEKKFSSLKKSKKVETSPDHGNSSLDRKYLRFLSGSSNVPVPTEHFRSYRRVPPNHFNDITLASHDGSITLNDSVANRMSPPLHLPPDMADYRLAPSARAGQTAIRQEQNTTLEAFMISRQGEERRQNQQNAASLIRPPQQFAPSVPNVANEDIGCRMHPARQSFVPSTSQKSDCRVSTPDHCGGWTDSFHQGSSNNNRNCNTIPDIQTKRLKKIASININVQPGDSNSMSELESTSERNQFQRNTHKSSSSSKLKSFFSSSHWQDSSSKGILGSPRLRRVLFGEKSDANCRRSLKSHPTSNSRHDSITSIESGQHPPDYPGLEYPPVFVPESYSLSYVTSILEARSNPNSNSPHDNGIDDSESQIIKLKENEKD